MFKKVLASAIASLVLVSTPAIAAESIAESIPEEVRVDSVTGASVSDYYADNGISGDELMDAINGPSGSYVISTVNEDGTPQVGFFVYFMVKDGEDYYVQLGLAENQTRLNLERTGEAMALYALNPSDDDKVPYAVSGARMRLELVTDEALIEKLNTSGYDTAMFCRVTEVRSLG